MLKWKRKYKTIIYVLNFYMCSNAILKNMASYWNSLYFTQLSVYCMFQLANKSSETIPKTVQLFLIRPNRRNNMLTVKTLMHYVSIVSFIDILVTNNHNSPSNHYGTVIIYITPSDPVVCEVSDRIVETLSE